MNKETLKIYKSSLNKSKLKNAKLYEELGYSAAKLNDDTGKGKMVLNFANLFLVMPKVGLHSYLLKLRQKAKVSKVTGYSFNQIAGDLPELIYSDTEIKCCTFDITYKANIPREKMKKVEIIWGNTHLEALDDLTCLGELKAIIGDLYLSKKNQDQKLEKLQTVTGDTYGNIIQKRK